MDNPTISALLTDIFSKHNVPLNRGLLANRDYLMNLLRLMRNWNQLSKHRSNDQFISDNLARVSSDVLRPIFRLEASDLARVIIMTAGRWEDDITDDIVNQKVVPIASEHTTWYWLWHGTHWGPASVVGNLLAFDGWEHRLDSYLDENPHLHWVAMESPCWNPASKPA